MVRQVGRRVNSAAIAWMARSIRRCALGSSVRRPGQAPGYVVHPPNRRAAIGPPPAAVLQQIAQHDQAPEDLVRRSSRMIACAARSLAAPRERRYPSPRRGLFRLHPRGAAVDSGVGVPFVVSDRGTAPIWSLGQAGRFPVRFGDGAAGRQERIDAPDTIVSRIAQRAPPMNEAAGYQLPHAGMPRSSDKICTVASEPPNCCGA